MPPDQFREIGHRMVDWIADYWQSVESLPVRSMVQPGEVAAKLPSSPPHKPEADWNAIFQDLQQIILPGITHWQHPNFYAYFPANASGPAVLGELLAAGLGVQGMLWATSPACTELETRILDWLADMLQLPDAFHSARSAGRDGGPGGGVIQGTASEAAVAAMAAARVRARRHATVGELVAYASDQAHSSIAKAAMITGIATGPDDAEHIRLIPTDSAFRMRPDLLRAAIHADRAAGRLPFFVCASVGTTGCTAIDPTPAIAHVLRELADESHRPWLHIDAAHAGAACICPEFRPMIDGVEHADSICFNPHKWLLTNFDCDCFWTRDRASLISAMSITPDYLKNQASDTGRVIDYRDWHIPLGRRFRALKLWFVIRHYGVEGLQAYIRQHIAWAAALESQIAADNRFEIVAPRTMNLVCFRLRPRTGPGNSTSTGESPAQTDQRNRELLDSINATGRAYLTHTTLRLSPDSTPAFILRMAIGATTTREEHVRQTWELIRSLAT
jgi:aromatic-L-amino-acid/L-tryptophan decarboxylase